MGGFWKLCVPFLHDWTWSKVSVRPASKTLCSGPIFPQPLRCCVRITLCATSVKTVYVPIVPLTSFGFTWPSRLPSLPAEAGRVSKRNLPQKIHIFFCKTRQNSKEGKEKEILVNELGNSQAGGKYFQQTVPQFKFRIRLSFKLHDLDIQTPAPDNPCFKMMFLLQRRNFFQVWWSRVQHYPDHLYCPKLDCSAHNMAALLYSELCNTVTHVPAPPGYVLLQQPFIFNIVEKQRCRKVNVELLSRQESPLEPWRPGNWERPPRKTDLSLSQEESQVSWICCKRLKNGSITSDRASLYAEFPLHDSLILSNESL